MIAPYKITYNGFSSLDMDCWTGLTFNGDDGEVETHLAREAQISESHNGSRNHIHGYKWSDPFTCQVTFTKQDYSDFTSEENRKMLKWLTGNSNASFIDIYMDDSEVIEWSSLGNWVNVSQYKLGNGRIVGYVAEWEAAHPWVFSPLYTITKDISNPNDNTITINLETDDSAPVYPRITIQQNDSNIITINRRMGETDNWVEGSVCYNEEFKEYYWYDAKENKRITDSENNSKINTTSVSIRNTHTDVNGNISVFNSLVKNNGIGEKITLDGANRVVSSSSTRIFGDNFDFNWIPLYEGKNELSFEGNCIVTVEYRSVIKCGEF